MRCGLRASLSRRPLASEPWPREAASSNLSGGPAASFSLCLTFYNRTAPLRRSPLNEAGLFRCVLTVNRRNCSLYVAVSFSKIFTEMCSCASLGMRPPTTDRPPTASWPRTCLLSDGTASGCPRAPGWLKHLSFLSRSIFKPFIFVDDVKLVPKTQSPCFGDDDPAKKEPRFQEKPDRRHELYKAHEWARVVIASGQVSWGGPMEGGEGGREGARPALSRLPRPSSPARPSPDPGSRGPSQIAGVRFPPRLLRETK